ncbi:MAG: hypothetical protein AT707_00115 [Pyrobaculum sp. JCHS_4]|jgi:Putative glycerate kinase|nr:MAG: hypothetical protein AT707_00115 [Pyrobaculum sp. JCHS_4]
MGHVGRAEDGVEAAGRRYDLSGAVADGDAAEETERAGLNPPRDLDDNGSYMLLRRLGRSIYTGPASTNVNDVFMALVYKT